MKVVMVAVISANGKLTRGNDPDIYKWTSKEDAAFFTSLVRKNNLIIRINYAIITNKSK